MIWHPKAQPRTRPWHKCNCRWAGENVSWQRTITESLSRVVLAADWNLDDSLTRLSDSVPTPAVHATADCMWANLAKAQRELTEVCVCSAAAAVAHLSLWVCLMMSGVYVCSVQCMKDVIVSSISCTFYIFFFFVVYSFLLSLCQAAPQLMSSSEASWKLLSHFLSEQREAVTAHYPHSPTSAPWACTI